MKKVIILFNDSDPVLARVAKVKLKNEADWDVIITADYNSAIQEISKSAPSVIITEIIIRDDNNRNGFDLIKEVRTQAKYDNVPIIVLSELSQEKDKEEAIANGANHYFVKSQIGIKDLIEKTQDILEQI